MSLLNKLKNTKNQHVSQQAAQLVKKHSLAKADHDTRLRYLAALALTCASEREIHAAEKLAYLGIAQSMSIEVQEAEEQLQERDSTSKDDMVSLFADIRKKQLAWRFLLDVAWIQVANETFEANALKAVAKLLEIDSNKIFSLNDLALARREKNSVGLLVAMDCIPESSGLHELLPELFEQVTDQGLADAQNNLGECYENGQGVSQDYAEAVKWYRKAAEQGLVFAQYNIGQCYYKGNGVIKDRVQSMKWYLKASEQGDNRANIGSDFPMNMVMVYQKMPLKQGAGIKNQLHRITNTRLVRWKQWTNWMRLDLTRCSVNENSQLIGNECNRHPFYDIRRMVVFIRVACHVVNRKWVQELMCGMKIGLAGMAPGRTPALPVARRPGYQAKPSVEN